MMRLNPFSSFQSLPRDLRLLFFSLFLWTFGLGLYNYVWSIYLRSLSANPEQVGLVYSISFIASALTMIPGGILANKYELRSLLIISWAMSIPPPLMFILARSWVDVIPGLVLLQLSAFSQPALNAYISGAGDRERITTAFGTVYAAAPLGLVFSPAIGGILLNWLQIRDLFLLSFLFFTISTIVLVPMRRQPSLKEDAASRKIEIPRSKLEVGVLVLLFGITTAYSITVPFLPLYSQDALGMSTSQIQLLGATQMLGTTFFSIFLGRMAVSRSKGGTMALGVMLASVGVLAIPLIGSPVTIFPMVFLLGAERAPGLLGYSVLSGLGKGASRAGRFGVYLTLEQLGFVGGSYVGGRIYTFNPPLVLFTTSVLLMGIAAMALVGIRTKTQGLTGEPTQQPRA